MQPFDFSVRTRMVFGENSLDQLGRHVVEQKGSRVLLVTDPGIVAAGHVARAVANLEAENLEVLVFDGAAENPTTDHVHQGVDVAAEYQPDMLVGLGGGSSMDCAKGINFVHSCGGKIQDYVGEKKATRRLLPMIAVPTTAGTGSEMQSYALISDAQSRVKMAIGDPRASCRVAILDPLLTLTQPETVTALTGIDAVSHAIETMVTTRSTPASKLFSVSSWERLADHFTRVIKSPDDVEARGAMQVGAAWAGLAIENSMLGASHALANPLTATFGVPHGQAVGMMLPHVIRYNGRDDQCQQDYAELLSHCELGKRNQHGATHRAAGTLSDLVSELVELAGLKLKLSELGIGDSDLPMLAGDAAMQWTGTFNPVPVDPKSLLSLYRDAL